MPKTKPKPLRGGVGDAPPPARKQPPLPPRPTAADVQQTVTALVRQHGANVTNWDIWAELLAPFGLKPGDVTPIMVLGAKDAVRAEQHRAPRAVQNYLRNVPVGESFLFGHREGVVLASDDCAVRVAVLSDSGRPEQTYYAPLTLVTRLGKKSPEKGRLGVDSRDPQPYDIGEEDGNRPQNPQEESNMATATHSPKAPKSTKKTVKEYERSEVLQMLQAMSGNGVYGPKTKTAAIDRVLNKLATAASPEELAKLDADPELAKLRDDILADLAAGKTLVATDDPKGEETPAPAPKPVKPAKPPKPSKNGNGRSYFRDKNGNPVKRGEGVVLAAHKIFQATSAKRPITRDEVCGQLSARFPDRDEKSIRKTVSDYISWWSHKRYGVKVQRDAKGEKFWLPASK